MSAVPKDSDGPTAGTRTARLAEVWEAANALAATQMPKQLSGSTRPSDISFESTNSVDHSSPIPLRHRRLVDAAIAPTSPSRWRLVAGLCLIAVILTGGTGAVIAFRQFPLADIWRDHVSSWTDSKRPASTMGRQQGFPRLRIETSRGMSGDPVKLALAIEGSAEGAVVIITGVLAGMEISTGNEVAAHRWEILPEDVPYAFVAPPEKFVGSVGLVAELRLANDKIVDRQPVYLEWSPPSPPGPAENQYNREEPAGPNRRIEDDPDREKAAAISSSTPPTADGIARQEAMALSTRPAESVPVRETTAAISSSASPPSEWQEAMVSSSPPVERNPDREETAASSSSAPAQERQEVTALSTTWVAADPNREKATERSSSTPPATDRVNRQEATASSTKLAANDSDREKAAETSSSTPPTADGIARQEAMALSTRPAESVPVRETTAAISSSASPPPEWQEAMVSSSSPVERNPDREETAAISNSSAPAQNQVRREEAMVPPSFPRNAQKQVDQNRPVTESRPPAFAQRQIDPEEISVLLKQGKDLIAHGDIAGARVALKRAAEANDAEAALALASTYDPFVLRELKVYGFSADAAMARAWYEKAKELGSAVAPRRLEILARAER